MALQPSNLRKALGLIIDPESGKDIVTAGMVKDIRSEGDDISIELEVQGADTQQQEQFQERIEEFIFIFLFSKKTFKGCDIILSGRVIIL